MTVKYAIDIVGLSKTFRRHTLVKGSYTTIKSLMLGRAKASSVKAATITKAVDDVTLRVPQGSSLGVIGRNGSGKSTLLKLITGIYKPSAGHVTVNGRVAALLELGAGFHPDFTGRENLELAAVMMGLSRKEIAARFDEIVTFAELEAVIDDPVRTYSSGMFMRLGFSVAVHTNPEVLLIDEVLAVGDVGFVRKCRDRLQHLKDSGTTLLMVSHDLDSVERFSDEVVWMHRGQVRERGEPRRVIDAYRQFVEQDDGTSQTVQAQQVQASATPSSNQRWGSREISIDAVTLEPLHHHLSPSDELRMRIAYSVREAAMISPSEGADGGLDVAFGVGISTGEGHLVFGTNSHIERVQIANLGMRGEMLVSLPRLSLREGDYSVDVAVHRYDGYPYDYRKNVAQFSVRSPTSAAGVYYPATEWTLKAENGSAAR